jgi:hypothetical protein
MRVIADRMRKIQDRLRELAAGRWRNASLALLRLASQLGRKVAGGVEIDLPLSRQSLADSAEPRSSRSAVCSQLGAAQPFGRGAADPHHAARSGRNRRGPRTGPLSRLSRPPRRAHRCDPGACPRQRKDALGARAVSVASMARHAAPFPARAAADRGSADLPVATALERWPPAGVPRPSCTVGCAMARFDTPRDAATTCSYRSTTSSSSSPPPPAASQSNRNRSMTVYPARQHAVFYKLFDHIDGGAAGTSPPARPGVSCSTKPRGHAQLENACYSAPSGDGRHGTARGHALEHDTIGRCSPARRPRRHRGARPAARDHRHRPRALRQGGERALRDGRALPRHRAARGLGVLDRAAAAALAGAAEVERSTGAAGSEHRAALAARRPSAGAPVRPGAPPARHRACLHCSA